MPKPTRSVLPIAALTAVLGFSAVGVTTGQGLLSNLLQPVLGLLGPVLGLLTNDLLDQLAKQPTQSAPIIMRGEVGALLDVAARHNLPVVRTLDEFIVTVANAAQVAGLAGESAVKGLASDLPVQSAMKVSDKAMGADQTRAGVPGSWLLGLGAIAGVTGKNIGVAIVDSGIAPHLALAGKVVAAKSFVPGDTSVNDAFGHGTHIAGIIAGAASAASKVTSEYSGGIAPGAQLINARVLGADGSGQTSSVIAGLDWVLANRGLHRIRVVNLSLGHPVTGPCVTDPLCSSIARLVANGLVVVVSAGNQGKAANGQAVLGGISSPGNSPMALTVGALNTWNTVIRSDDTVATYSSRGPTAYDLVVKPDVAAPGNKIVSLEAPNGYLARNYGALHVAGSGSNAYYRMSGTSMSAGMVSGAAALMLEAGPGLQPAQVKVALQHTATFLPRDGLMAAGAGSVNVWAARRAAGNLLLLSLPTSVIGGAAAPASGMAFFDKGTLADRLYAGSGRTSCRYSGSSARAVGAISRCSG